MSPISQFQPSKRKFTLALLGLLLCLILHRAIQLHQAASQPLDGILVLGGSIRREIAAARLTRNHPQLPLLISAGSAAPCIWAIFEREAPPTPAAAPASTPASNPANDPLINGRPTNEPSTTKNGSPHDPKSQVWLEPCATSTLGNYRYSLPILKGWGLHHVQLLTSGNHRQRATLLGRIILGSHGIWVSPAPVTEMGRPGNHESPLKTVLDLIRGLGWALVSQVYAPQCKGLVRLDQVKLKDWVDRDFQCEQQGQVELPAIFHPNQP